MLIPLFFSLPPRRVCIFNWNGEKRGFPGGTAVKNQLWIQETHEMQIGSLGREDPVEQEMATYSSILAWKIPWTEEPGGLQSMGLQRVRHDWVTKHTHTHKQHTHTHTHTCRNKIGVIKRDSWWRVLVRTTCIAQAKSICKSFLESILPAKMK